MAKFLNSLSGYKTYLVAFVGIVYYVSAWYTGHVDSSTAVNGLLASSALVGLRSALHAHFGSLADNIVTALTTEIINELNTIRPAPPVTVKESK
jgi:hypothetical protein